MRILITNDDGISSTGLESLERIAAELSDDVWVVAPETDQSGVAHSLTLSDPLRLRQISEKRFALRGTPTDCVIVATQRILPGKPDLVLSGINRGANLAEDITYSGTVAGAIEGTLLGIRSVAVSQAYNWDIDSEPPYETAEAHAPEIIRKIMAMPPSPDTLFNLNFPACGPDEVSGTMVTVQGKHEETGLRIDERRDGRGYPYFWLAFQQRSPAVLEKSDLASVANRWISVSPLRIDLTAHDMVAQLESVFA
ncbi:MAG: 5'/3'-nucleotidase SurE [Rhodobacteraceae bacterium]|nr:5'/3'-nucleotidase SurE [Paracoccaceae bacterium]